MKTQSIEAEGRRRRARPSTSRRPSPPRRGAWQAAQYEQTERERQQRHLDRLDRRQQQQLERLGGRR